MEIEVIQVSFSRKQKIPAQKAGIFVFADLGKVKKHSYNLEKNAKNSKKTAKFNGFPTAHSLHVMELIN